jgi:FixJ family two-component response regulator
MDGRKLHRVFSATHAQALMISISAFQDEQVCERALALGAFTFLSRPLRKRVAMHR